MPRSLTPASIPAVQAQETGEVFLALLTIDLGGGQVWRVVNNTDAIISRGQAFTAWPFALSLPDETDTANSQAVIRIDNVDPALWQLARTVTEAPTLTVELIMASRPDEVMFSIGSLRLREGRATSLTIEATLMIDNLWQTGFPADDFSPQQYAGLFQTSLVRR